MKYIAFILIIFCFSTANFAQTSADLQSFPLQGVFKDKDSAVFAGLNLNFEKDGQKINSYTDENGEFKVSLPSGEYKLTINKSISEDFVSYINIQEKGLNPNNIEFVVKPGLQCCQTASGVPFPKVISIPKPPFPPAARAVHAFGEVIVSVKIDKDGKVISAQAVSGHPLLRQTSVVAAKQSLFETSENSAEREANLSFVFINRSDKTKEVKHYSNPFRIEVTPAILTIDY